MNVAQKKYSTTKKKEFLAIFESPKEFCFIILGYDITVLTDHRPLSYLFRKKLPIDSAMARWSLEVESFNVTIKYLEGKRNIVADYLSRIEGKRLSVDILENCENLICKDSDAMMVTTRSKKKKKKKKKI